MPPQRRKIVPPNTTSKARKKVAGSSRRPADETAPEASSTDTVAGEPVVAEPVVAEPAADEKTTASDAVASDTVSLDKSTPETASSKDTTVDGVAGDDENAVGDENADAAVGSDSARTNWLPAAVVGVVAVLLIAFATVAALKPGASVDNQAWVDQGSSSEVTRAATDGLTALYRYNYETIDDDLAKAREVMGPDMQADTDKFVDVIKSNAQQTQTATDVDVMDIGLTRLESDKAELLANLNVSSTRAGVAYGNAMFPLVINMEKVDGKWVVSSTRDK